MISQPLLKELNTIISEDYGMDLQPSELADLGDSLVGLFKCLAEINKENNGQ